MKTIAQQLNVKDFPFVIKDKNGNAIYYEYSDGHWCKREYDSNGKITYQEDPYGYCWKRKYDSNGNCTYFEDSNEVWIKKEFDSNGNRIYYEDSYGYIEDNRPKGCEGRVVEIDGKKYKLTEV